MMGCCSVLCPGGTRCRPGHSDLNRFGTSPPSRKESISFLKASKNIAQIHRAHAQVVRKGLSQDPFVAFELLRACRGANSIDYAVAIFATLEEPNVFHYTAPIEGHVSSGSVGDAMSLYYEMVSESILPDNYVTASFLKACALGLALREGREVHGQVMKLGLSCNRVVGINLMEVYGKCGEFQDAWKVFDNMPEQDAVLRTVMMSCYFDRGRVGEACAVFDGVGEKDTICWTALIDGLVRNGEIIRALEAFREMQWENVKPNEVTIVCVLSACAQQGALELGRWVHSYLGKFGIELNRLGRCSHQYVL